MLTVQCFRLLLLFKMVAPSCLKLIVWNIRCSPPAYHLSPHRRSSLQRPLRTGGDCTHYTPLHRAPPPLLNVPPHIRCYIINEAKKPAHINCTYRICVLSRGKSSSSSKNKKFWDNKNDVFHEADASPTRLIVSSIIYRNVPCVTCAQQ